MGVKDEQRERRRGAGNSGAKRSTGYSSDSEFINLELDKKQTAAYREWRNDLENVLNLWLELVEAGYRVNTKYDDYSSACACFIIPMETTENGGYILTGRGSSPYRALTEAIYKHQEILHGDWSQGIQKEPLDRDPDF